jgi:GTP-binding protein HflX
LTFQADLRAVRTGPKREKAILIGLIRDGIASAQARDHLDELELLADTAGADCVGKHLQSRPHPDPSTYIGKGKLQELATQAEGGSVDVIIFDDELTGSQIRNIEKATKRKVLDRTGLILDIFASRAKSTASRNQVELAQLQYLLPRLTRFWTHLSRQSGGIGTKGPGETQIETDRRLIGRRIATLKENLVRIDRQRSTQSKGRQEWHRIAIVGYTNAGKSTLMNTLTDTQVLAEDRLFATLDSTVRRWKLFNRTVLLSDTVGFIRKLPHHLVESFKSTLDEVRDADVLLHVVDITSPTWEEHIEVVKETLKDLGAADKPTCLVFNKVDGADEDRIREVKAAHPGSVFVSAERGIGLDGLRKEIDRHIEAGFRPFAVRIPLREIASAMNLRRVAVIENESYDEDWIHLKGRIDRRSEGWLPKPADPDDEIRYH